ncbi:sporulation protein [Bacillus mesophilus]|uniref:Sporulation protein n=2 Tax=Bacillus mesophilus TaxID=1808955 RepID=A0A6M0Q8P5_9BACI|nr:sporulation protein [Bacillus mesophilus]
MGGPTLGSAQINNDYNLNSSYAVKITAWNEMVQQILKQYYSQNYNVSGKEKMQQQVVQQPKPKVNNPDQNQTTEETNQPIVALPEQQESPFVTQQESNTTEKISLSQFEQQVVSLTNHERASYGLKPLSIDSELSKVARLKSSDMKQNGYFSHTSPTYGSPFDMMKQFGVQYRTAGENIAMGQRSAEEVVRAWMNSEGHRKNILNPSFTHIGVGHVEGNYWTQLFIGR